MKATTLESLLLAEGCSPNNFSVGLQNMRSDTYCLAYIDARWQVFYTERGNRNAPIFESTSETEACTFFFDKIMRMQHRHLVGLFEDGEQASQFQALLAQDEVETLRNDMPPMRAGTPPVKRVFVLGKAILRVRKRFPKLPVKELPSSDRPRPVANIVVESANDPSVNPDMRLDAERVAASNDAAVATTYKFAVEPFNDVVLSDEAFRKQFEKLNRQIRRHQGNRKTLKRRELNDFQRQFLHQLFAGPLEVIVQAAHAETVDFYVGEPSHVRKLRMHVHQLTLPQQAGGVWEITVGESAWGATLVIFSMTGWQVTERVFVG